MASNFEYIKQLAEKSGIDDFLQLHTYCEKAELFQTKFYEESANNARKALEWLLRNMLEMKGIHLGDTYVSISDMRHMPEFYEFVGYDEQLKEDVRKVHMIGNSASHQGAKPVTRASAFICLRSLFRVAQGFLFRWGAIKEPLAAFDAELIPTLTMGSTGSPTMGPVVTTTPEPTVSPAVVASVPQEAIEHPQVPTNVPAESLQSEAITRKYLIDYMLEDAGWEVLHVDGDIQGGKACIEVNLTPTLSQGEGVFPSKSGRGRADYVLFSRGGKPLAVIEAKATSHEVGEGRRQGLLYADCLEARYGVRPVIYYTNGFETRVIDGIYPDRNVYAFHSMDDLERLIQKRDRSAIRDREISDAITNRPYQKAAINSLLNWLDEKHRRGLLVLATGTGKTRVSISLCDVLMRNNWVKNVLFLADRTSLVNQAHRNYENLLPNVSMSVLSEEREPDMQARIMFSTYQTMINYIDKDDKKFSVGRFDLIIIDEAHRSVFGRYGSIFKYFDSLLIGLTATPRDEIDRSTFELLELDGQPNFEYDMKDAVAEGYLIDYKTRIHNSKVMEQGIKYDDLSEEERDELEKVWTYEKAMAGVDPGEDFHRDIEAGEIFKYLINTDTIDMVLNELMTNGLKVKSGDEIGKTIIFAYNHLHAEHVVERFRQLYPEKGEKYCQLIDNYVKYSQGLILDFEDPEKLPQIAVSVDMLDTGIDVPSILNLVFFKSVKSKIKFMQMIGRGTRLWGPLPTSPYSGGDGYPKSVFYIFDWCNNFEYFGMHPDGAEGTSTISLTERLFHLRLDIAFALQTADHQEKEFDKKLHDELKEILISQVKSLSQSRIDVREKWNVVVPFQDKEQWTCLTAVDVARLKSIAVLLPRPTENEAAKKFDVLVLHIMLSQVEPAVSAGKCIPSVVTIGRLLEEKGTLPMVRAHIDTIREVQKQVFWENVSLDSLERVRTELRELVHLLSESRKDKKFVINIEDTLLRSEDGGSISLNTTYRERVIDYLQRHLDNPVLRKIQNLEQLSADDVRELERIFFEELGTREEYDRTTDGMPYRNNVAAFIRTMQGVDRGRALGLYFHFINSHDMTSMQEQYLKNILDYVSQNGDIQANDLVNGPLKDIQWRATFGDKFADFRKFVNELHQVISVTA